MFDFRVVLSEWCVGGLHDSMHGLCWGELFPTFDCCVYVEFAVRSVLSCVTWCWMAVPLHLVVVVYHNRVEAHHETQHGMIRCGVSGQAVQNSSVPTALVCFSSFGAVVVCCLLCSVC